VTDSDQCSHVDCAVVIVTYNSARYITDLLDSLPTAAGDLTLRIVVVDNGSTDDTVERVREHVEVICVETGANLGYSGGINVGRKYAGHYAALAVLNPDLTLEPGALHEMFSVLNHDQTVGVVVPMLFDFDGYRYPSLRREPTLTNAIGDALFGQHFKHRSAGLSEIVWNERDYDHRHPVDWGIGAVMLVSAACDRVVGDWDEEFFLYSEEIDYQARTRAAGFRVEYVPQARAHHRKQGSGQSRELKALQAVNRIRYFEKHGKPARLMRAVVLIHELLRSTNPGHRVALLKVLRRSTWEPLTSDLKATAAKTATFTQPMKA
jgi:GT2 family glycosyltransferase